LTLIEGASHAIPDSTPELAAALTLKMISGEKDYQHESLYLAGEEGEIKHCPNLAALKKHACQ
jgi:hypothetical protein